MSISKWGRCIVVLLLGISLSYTAPQDIGDFDINKVRAATLPDDSGQQTANNTPVQKEHVANVLVRVTIYLVIVILLIVSVAWLLRRNALGVLHGGGGTMDIIETLPVGPNRMLVMVRVMDEIYLLSQTTANILLIDKIGGQKAVDIIASSGKSDGAMIQFKDAFNNFMGKIKKTQ